MPRRLFDENLNTPEHYNHSFGNRRFEIDYREPLRAEAMLRKFNGGRFLEVGCGVATHCQLAKEIPNSEVYGMDFSDKLIESLKERFKGINYSVGDIRDLKFGDEMFDYIVMGEVIEHMEDPAEVLNGVCRILKKGGILAVSTPENDNGSFSPKEHIWSFSRDELAQFLIPFGKVEASILNERNHNFIIAYLTKK